MSEPSSSLPSRPETPLGALLDIQTTRPAFRFNYDSGIRKTGPESVSGTTEGRGADTFAAPPKLGFLNISAGSNAHLGLGALPAEWSSSKLGFHAISTVLNNPSKKQAPPKAHSSLPAVPPAELPRVRRKDFDSYLKAIKPQWEQFERSNRLGREGIVQLDDEVLTPRPPFALPATVGPPQETPTSSSIPLSPAASSYRTPFSVVNGGIGNTESRNIPPLDSVPVVFFDPNFNLGDPQTFGIVTEQQHLGAADALNFDNMGGTSSQQRRNSLTSDSFIFAHTLPLLDDKFSHYADTVEQHLIREIAIRSTSFFAALTNLNDLQTESEQCLSRISSLRASLKEVDEKVAKKGLEVVRTECKVSNVGKVRKGMEIVGEIMKMSKLAGDLVKGGQWDEALNVIEEMQGMWKDEEKAKRDELDGKLEGYTYTAGLGIITPSTSTSSVGTLDGSTGKPKHRPNSILVSRQPALLVTPEEEENVESTTVRSAKPLKAKVHIPISSLSAFSALPQHLKALTYEIATSLSSDLVNILKDDLLERMEGARLQALGQPEERSSNGNTLEEKMQTLLRGLMRTNGIKDAVLTWREIATRLMREVLKRQFPDNALGDDLPSETQPATQPARPSLVAHLQNMLHPEFLVILKSIYATFLSAIEGIQTQNKTLLDILKRSDFPPHLIPNISYIEEELTDILLYAAELAASESAKPIHHRAEQHAHLELHEFVAFFRDSWTFVVKCEVICRKMIVGLRGVAVGQAREFLRAFHQTRISRLARLVEDEKWAPVDVTPALQKLANVVIESAVRDAPELIILSADGQQPGQQTQVNGLSNTMNPGASPNPTNGGAPPASAPPLSSSGGNGTFSGASKHLKIEDRSYFIVSATSEVLILLLEYLRLIVNLPMFTPDTMSKVIEFLKAFNSRTCQVVLGAGALRSAGLKNITAKHLALASQSLTIMYELIPYVRETFRRHLNPQQAVMLVDFDKLKRDFQEHQNEIHSKLIVIMGDRISIHIASLQAVDWNTQKPGGGVNDYVEIIAKDTVLLHKVLSRYLSVQITEYVMSQVFAVINHRLSEEYGKIELPDLQAKERLLADTRYIHQKLSVLKNVGKFSTMLETVVSEKSVATAQNHQSHHQQQQQQRPAPVQPPTRSNTFYNVGSSANQRLKGLLSSKKTTLPTPSTTPESIATPPIPEKSLVPNTGPNQQSQSRPNSRPTTPGPPVDINPSEYASPQASKATTGLAWMITGALPGFKHVEMGQLPDANPRPSPSNEASSNSNLSTIGKLLPVVAPLPQKTAVERVAGSLEISQSPPIQNPEAQPAGNVADYQDAPAQITISEPLPSTSDENSAKTEKTIES